MGAAGGRQPGKVGPYRASVVAPGMTCTAAQVLWAHGPHTLEVINAIALSYAALVVAIPTFLTVPAGTIQFDRAQGNGVSRTALSTSTPSAR
jgi:hypothetical protein